MEKVKVKVRAKINPFLSIKDSENGYHNLDTVFVSISEYDEIYACKSDITRVFIDGEERVNSNAYKATVLMKEIGASDAEIFIRRGITSGGGLGSSSADAAGVIRALNALFDLQHSDETLMKVGKMIGSDVPYMLTGGWARLRGSGTELEFFDAPTGEELLLAVKDSVNTGECFRLFDETPLPYKSADAFVERVKSSGLLGSVDVLHNALTPSAVILNPEIERALNIMKESGINASMTGSGATVWGIGNEVSVAIAQRELIKSGYTVSRVKTVSKGVEIS